MRSRGPVGELERERVRCLVESFVWEHAIDYVPALERGGVVQLPVITSSRARAGPARSARRCVPPIAGVRPTTVSTSPNRADSAASRMSQPSENSNAAVRHSECAAKTVGSGSSLDTMDEIEQAHPHGGGLLGGEPVEDVHVDAAADNATLGPDQQPARGLGDERSTASESSPINCWSNRFSGGLSMLRTVSGPSCSRRTKAHRGGSIGGESLHGRACAGEMRRGRDSRRRSRTSVSNVSDSASDESTNVSGSQ